MGWRPGKVILKITSADVAMLLTQLNSKSISIEDLRIIDELTLQAVFHKKDIKTILSLIQHRGDQYTIVGQKGLVNWGLRLIKRPFLIGGVLALFLLTVYLPKKVFFIQVEGNASIPVRRILEAVESSGVYFGADRSEIRSEKVKNELLSKIPQLKWVGVNTKGCVATVSVREKTENVSLEQSKSEVTSIIAATDGIIVDCTVTKGNPLCKVGDAVKKGQTLVSGYTDLGLIIQATSAEAEIYAQTFRKYEMIGLFPTAKTGAQTNRKTRYSMVIGKNLIKFYKDSGIYTTTCDKMYVEKNITLPGGFHLPVVIRKETILFYDDTITADYSTDQCPWLEQFAQAYLKDHMTAGQILYEDVIYSDNSDHYGLTANYICNEMIARKKYEEIILYDGQNG